MSLSLSGTAYLRGGTTLTAVPLTLACWFKSTSQTADQDAICLVSPTSDSNYFRLNVAGSTAGDPVRAITNAVIAVTSTGYTANTWHHGAAVFAATNSRAAYINGGSKGTQTSTATPTLITRTTIGRLDRMTPTAQFAGDIAEVGIWNVALTDAEVAVLAKGFSPARIRPQSLVFYAPLIRDAVDLRAGLALTATSTAVSNHPRIYQ